MAEEQKKNKKKRELLIGVGVIVIAVLIVIVSVKNLFTGQEPQADQPVSEPATEQTLANDQKDIDPKQAKKQMNLTLEIDRQVKKRVPELETLEEEFSDYLIKEDFYGDVTRAICTNVVTEDFNQGTLVFSFNLNNPDRTPVDVIYNKKKGTYSFNYY